LNTRWRKKTYNPKLSIDKPLSQADMDAYNWGVIALASDGYDTELMLIVRECRKCGRIEHFAGYTPPDPKSGKRIRTSGAVIPYLQNGISPLAIQYGRIYMNYVDAHSSSIVVENLETGEVEPAGDLLRMLQGMAPEEK
ncbi:MAG: hypothetical protein K2F99_02995, partial [Muribaculaceae bacterium]|nr:hypothetical protein [Muribaculaceae bacterium]